MAAIASPKSAAVVSVKNGTRMYAVVSWVVKLICGTATDSRTMDAKNGSVPGRTMVKSTMVPGVPIKSVIV